MDPFLPEEPRLTNNSIILAAVMKLQSDDARKNMVTFCTIIILNDKSPIPASSLPEYGNNEVPTSEVTNTTGSTRTEVPEAERALAFYVTGFRSTFIHLISQVL